MPGPERRHASPAPAWPSCPSRPAWASSPASAECVAAILGHLGCDAWVTAQPDVRGWQAAVAGGAEVIFAADDYRFVALNIRTGVCVDDDPATADGFVAALDAAAGGVGGRNVLVLGLGPVGRAAAAPAAARAPPCWPPSADAARVAGRGTGLELRRVGLDEGLQRCRARPRRHAERPTSSTPAG